MRFAYLALAVVAAPALLLAQKSGWNAIRGFSAPIGGNGAPTEIALGADGALWFVERDNNLLNGRIGRITPDGSATGFGGFAFNPQGITAGPDGAMWFTEASGCTIDRITAAGVITAFPIPVNCTQAVPQEIITGPDGALWFTLPPVKAVMRMTTAGVVTSFPTPAIPVDLATGPDGAIWFLEGTDAGGPGAVVRMATNGFRIADYNLAGTGTGTPTMITAGPDGALWFADNAGNICRITIAGVITRYPVTTQGEFGGLTVGPDRALWFTLVNSNDVGRITTRGNTTLYPLPIQHAEPIGISPGPDGGVWFTQPGSASIIGRAWACGLGMNASVANTTLNLNYDLSLPAAGHFTTTLFTGSGSRQLWSFDIPALVPPVPFNVPVGPGFPSVGNVAVVSMLSLPSAGLVCAESQFVDTGGTGPSLADLQQMLQAAAPR